MYVCMYECMYVRTYVCMYACMYVCMDFVCKRLSYGESMGIINISFLFYEWLTCVNSTHIITYIGNYLLELLKTIRLLI